MMSGNDGHGSQDAETISESELLRSQRDVNEQLVLSMLRAHEDAAATETELRNERRASLRMLADAMPLLAWYANPNGYVHWYNQRWVEYTGMSIDEQKGSKWQIVHDPNDLPRILTKWNAALESGEVWEDEFRLRRRDGSLRWFLSRAVPLRDIEGQIVRWFGTHIDIDDQKRAEKAVGRGTMLATLAAKVGRAFTRGGPLREILDRCCSCIVRYLDGAVARIWTVDDSGTVLELQASAGMHAPLAHLDGAHSRIHIGDQEIGWIAATREPLIADNVSADSGMIDSEWALGAGPIAVAGYPLVVAGQLVGVLAMSAHRSMGAEVLVELASITDTIAIGIARAREEEKRGLLLASERETRKDAEAANRIKDEFLATMSHELRTPLNAILGWSSLLRREQQNEKNTDYALASIERNARAQAQIIDDLLDVSNIINGKLRLDMHRVDINAIALAAVDVVRQAADAKRVRLVVDLAPEEGALVGDPDRLQQIIWNLLSNAVKFTPPEGSVTLRVQPVESTVRITVRDTGSGIALEHLRLIFERFRQVDNSITRSHGGLGLGLAIVRHLSELHGGTAAVESGGKGLGATFTVNLPLRAVPDATDEAGRAPR